MSTCTAKERAMEEHRTALDRECERYGIGLIEALRIKQFVEAWTAAVLAAGFERQEAEKQKEDA